MFLGAVYIVAIERYLSFEPKTTLTGLDNMSDVEELDSGSNCGKPPGGESESCKQFSC